jgi:hypothetical protein
MRRQESGWAYPKCGQRCVQTRPSHGKVAQAVRDAVKGESRGQKSEERGEQRENSFNISKEITLESFVCFFSSTNLKKLSFSIGNILKKNNADVYTQINFLEYIMLKYHTQYKW